METPHGTGVYESGRSLLTARQVAQHFQVHERTVRRWAIEGVIPSIAVGPGTVRFDPRDVDALLSAQRR
jgi:excisionase family DNA binding protein